MTKSLSFYATRSDLEALIEQLERTLALHYVPTGIFDTPDVPDYRSGLDLPSLGEAVKGDAVREPGFLVLPADVELRTRLVASHNGGCAYHVDQLANPTSLVFKPAGDFKGRAVIQGSVGTGSDHATSRMLLGTFRRVLKRLCAVVHGHFVAPEALSRFNTGMRLTSDVNVRFYDLNLPERNRAS